MHEMGTKLLGGKTDDGRGQSNEAHKHGAMRHTAAHTLIPTPIFIRAPHNHTHTQYSQPHHTYIHIHSDIHIQSNTQIHTHIHIQTQTNPNPTPTPTITLPATSTPTPTLTHQRVLLQGRGRSCLGASAVAHSAAADTAADVIVTHHHTHRREQRVQCSVVHERKVVGEPAG